MSAGPWIVVVRTRQRVVSVYFHVTRRAVTKRIEQLQAMWDGHLTKIVSYDLPELLKRADTAAEAEVHELERMYSHDTV